MTLTSLTADSSGRIKIKILNEIAMNLELRLFNVLTMQLKEVEGGFRGWFLIRPYYSLQNYFVK